MPRRTPWPCATLTLGTIGFVAITSATLTGAIGTRERPPRMSFDCDPSRLQGAVKALCLAVRFEEGRRLFEDETFGGNGRTCATCHDARTGTFSPESARRRLARNPADPLFVHDGLDDGVQGTSRITEHATAYGTVLSRQLREVPGGTCRALHLLLRDSRWHHPHETG